MKESAGDVGRQVKAVLKRAGLLDSIGFRVDVSPDGEAWDIRLFSHSHAFAVGCPVPKGDPIAIPRAVAEAAAAVRRAIQSGEAKRR